MDGPQRIPAGSYPPELEAACQMAGADPRSLLAWAVRKEEVVLVLESGQKVVIPVEGAWKPRARKRQQKD